MSVPPPVPATPVSRTTWLGPARAADDPATPLLVLLHGYGSHEGHMLALAPALQMFLPGVSARVLAVRGSFPATERRLAGGSAWFPGPLMEQPPAADIALVADRVAAAIRTHAAPRGPVVVAGFSQGMCTAITVLRRHPSLITGLVGLSGYLYDTVEPGDAELAVRATAGHGVPAFVGYDPADPRVPAVARQWAVDFLRTHTALTERTYPGMGHSVAPAEVMDVAGFLRSLLTG